MMNKTTVALVDDHVLLRNGLSSLINSFEPYHVLFEADNGKVFIEQLQAGNIPEMVLLDINMPVMDGFETSSWLKINYPEVKIIALSMYDNESAIIRMFKNGAKGYILKDCDPSELKEALDNIHLKGFFISELVSGKLIHSINNLDEFENPVQKIMNLNEKEIEFIKLSCTELTYKEIADKLGISPRTVDGYRDMIFEKLNIKTRVGLAMYAIKHCIVTI